MRLIKSIFVLGVAAFAANSYGALIQGSSLQDGLDNISQDGTFLSGDVNSDQMKNTLDERWKITGSGGSFNALIFEIAAFADDNTFGIYDLTNSSNRLEIFDGSAVNDSSATLTIDVVVGGYEFTNSATGDTSVFGSSMFGYYLDASANAASGGDLFFSEKDLNENNVDHMVTFAGDGVEQIDIENPVGDLYATFGLNEFILAWEDLVSASSDFDYSDMVVLVESVEPVPAPGALAILGVGLLAIGFTRRRRVAS